LQVIAQGIECGFVGVDLARAQKLIYYGNNKYLHQKVDEIKQLQKNQLLQFNQIITDEFNNQSKSTNSICPQTVRYHLPLRIVVHRDVDNNTLINNNTIDRLVEEMNERFEESGTEIRLLFNKRPCLHR
jgi:hypothetical protein